MTQDTSEEDNGIERSNEAKDDQRHICRMTDREDGLIGKYNIWLCQQSFRELAPTIGFKKYD